MFSKYMFLRGHTVIKRKKWGRIVYTLHEIIIPTTLICAFPSPTYTLKEGMKSYK